MEDTTFVMDQKRIKKAYDELFKIETRIKSYMNKKTTTKAPKSRDYRER